MPVHSVTHTASLLPFNENKSPLGHCFSICCGLFPAITIGHTGCYRLKAWVRSKPFRGNMSPKCAEGVKCSSPFCHWLQIIVKWSWQDFSSQTSFELYREWDEMGKPPKGKGVAAESFCLRFSFLFIYFYWPVTTWKNIIVYYALNTGFTVV